MKLEVGQFARLKSGYICKIININDFREPNMKYGVEANYLKDVMFIGDDDIVKASYNIIDILEVGDYVNGYKVTGIGGTYHGRKDIAIYCDYQENEKTRKWIMIYDDEIKSVITHEQMEQMAYKVGE